ncbi:MAG TPA: helix-turn-helix domain-containing protein, partial [Gemmatimonadaceae bacterium]|nr:helix-turn-helix domain-containing protein [Gemmatimonadaceae bacterium]
MALLSTLLPDPERLSRLRDVLRDRYVVHVCGDWGELLEVCARRAVSVAVVDPYWPQPGAVAFDELRLLKRRFPSVAVVPYLSVPATTPHDLFELGRFGLDAVIVAEHDDREDRRMLARIEQAEARGLTEALRRALGDVRPTARDAMLVAVTRAHQRLSPDSLSRILGVRRKLLGERLVQAGFPSPQPLIAWGRLIVAARLLEDPERSADNVALALEYPSGSAFRNSCQRYLGATPHEIRARGGAKWVIAE